MISDNEIDALLERINDSDSFGSSSTYERLLRFLVTCTRSGTIPKEQVVSEHLFGKNAVESGSSKVRVYVYNLRKKLRLYFEREGKEEVYKLSIPKGGYKVKFERREQNTLTAPSSIRQNYFRWLVFTVLLLSLLINVFLVLGKDRENENIFAESIFWKAFFEDDKPIQIIIGDLFVFSEVDTLIEEYRSIRIPHINTETQFEDYKTLEKNAQRTLNEMTYTYLLKGSAEWILNLTKVFHPNKEFNIRVSSMMEAKDLHDYNIIFVGMQKTAGIFNSYLDGSTFEFDVEQPNEYLHQIADTTLSYSPKGSAEERHKDYGLIAKYPGPNDNTIFMFSGLWDSATSESLRNFTTPSKLAKMEEYIRAQLGYVPPYFEIFIEVNGIDRIGFEAKILHVREINGSM